MPINVGEKNPLADAVSMQNLGRQYDFLRTAFLVWEHQVGMVADHRFIKELNFYAVQYLSDNPGAYREVDVLLRGARHRPPPWQEVQGHMDAFFARYDAQFAVTDPVDLAAWALWRINWIHPFEQGNGRTARAISYFILCQKLGMWLPGTNIIPEQIRATRDEYCNPLDACDPTAQADGSADLAALNAYISRLLKVQLTP